MAALGAVSRTLDDRQPLGIRLTSRPFSVLLASGSGHGVEGSGVGGWDHRPDRGPAARHRTTTHADHQSRRDTAVPRPGGGAMARAASHRKRACGATLRRRLEGWSAVALLRRAHVALLRMVRSGPGVAAQDVVVDSGSVRAKRGGELTGRNPTDRGKL